MSFFNEARESIMKYSEKFVNKTEEYAKIGKLTMDIKKNENSIEKAYAQLGKNVFEKITLGASEIKADEETISQQVEAIHSYNKTIEEKRNEIEEIKKYYRETEQEQETQHTPSQETTNTTTGESTAKSDKPSEK